MKPEKIPTSSSNDPSAFAVWGAISGAVIGLIIGLITRHWLWPVFGCLTAGWIIGAVIDRSRRK